MSHILKKDDVTAETDDDDFCEDSHDVRYDDTMMMTRTRTMMTMMMMMTRTTMTMKI